MKTKETKLMKVVKVVELFSNLAFLSKPLLIMTKLNLAKMANNMAAEKFQLSKIRKSDSRLFKLPLIRFLSPNKKMDAALQMQ